MGSLFRIRPTDSSPKTPVSRFFEHLLKKHENNSADSQNSSGTDTDSVKFKSSTVRVCEKTDCEKC